MEANLFSLLFSFFVIGASPASNISATSVLGNEVRYEKMLSSREISLRNRHNDRFVNEVFSDNILLNLAYLAGTVNDPKNINWDEIRETYHYEFRLEPGDVFSFHDDVTPEYKEKLKMTSKAHFSSVEGFKSDGYLYGDGVCHLASIINWAAKDAGLKVVAPTNHDFALIPEIPREYGTSIYYYPGNTESNTKQNLYIENNSDAPVKFLINYSNGILNVSVFKM